MSEEKNTNPVLEDDAQDDQDTQTEQSEEEAQPENADQEDQDNDTGETGEGAENAPEPEAPESEPVTEPSQGEEPVNAQSSEDVISQGVVNNTDKDIGIKYTQMSNEMKKVLDAQPRVQMYIPKEPKEPNGAVETVQINGYRMEIQKGTMVNVPKQVFDILSEYMGIENRVGQDKKINNQSEDVQQALS